MPELHVIVRWPDEAVMACYSPSVVITEYFSVGQDYTVAEFVDRSREALEIASERVRAKYGHPCPLARASFAAIDAKAKRLRELDGDGGWGAVRVEAFEPPR